ncbi:MBL fold metallo-hydrolase [Mycobacterium sp. Y57]|uniref:MBL fold metallo-hydrolase n=1 Tax=Mycolicibacterium xanthum TaxID=2796469 RepID=UPI001C86358F|nr:rhodanese-like domain-containing protein [Mycolicibacterium xanthum]MBX7431492.1 MBL fold metallo-hydrolase [Mycolicibacterium xanthum]
MKFIQYYLDCLSHASYLIADEESKRAVVVDPQRDVSEYLRDAEELGLKIELVIETHFHADFLSGHLELAEAAGATIVYSSVAEPEFDYMGVDDGQTYALGGPDGVTLKFLHTPGHTPESMSIVVYEHGGDEVPYGVMTGDTLFIGDVGRPDLLASIGFSRDELADMLYDSLHNKLMPLPDATRVYPAHGAGSACGKNLSTELWSTMGDQKEWNYALRAADKPTFMAMVTEGQPPAPSYFVYDAILNRKDRELLDETKMPQAMTYQQALDAVAGGAILVDGRGPDEFAQGHLRGAVNIGLEGRYAEFAGSVVKPDVDIVLMTDDGQELEGKNRLARIGFDNVIGYLAEPEKVMFTHIDQVEVASRLSAKQFGERAADVSGLQIVDVRNPGEAAAGMIPGAVNIPVGQLPDRIGELDANAPTVVYCAGGYRSSVAASLLRNRGFGDVSDILGGYNAWDEVTQKS